MYIVVVPTKLNEKFPSTFLSVNTGRNITASDGGAKQPHRTHSHIHCCRRRRHDLT